jgi:hypothetical protein
MQVLALLIPLAVLGACSREPEVTPPSPQCLASITPPYDEKVFDRCVAGCIKCENGVMTTCSTSCRLKGAR